MNRFGAGVVCILAFGLLSGCAHVQSSGNDTFQSFLAFLHLKSRPAEKQPEPQTQPQVCVLDPLAYTKDITADPAAANDKAPVAEVPESTFDFGKVTDGTEVVHKFSVKNKGKTVLNIKKVLPG